MNKYLSFLEQYRKYLKSLNLSPYCEQILGEVAIHNATNELAIRSTTLLARKHLGSPATIHKNFFWLVKKGYLSQRIDDDDRRIKYIELTQKSHDYFNKINDLLKSCK